MLKLRNVWMVAALAAVLMIPVGDAFGRGGGGRGGGGGGGGPGGGMRGGGRQENPTITADREQVNTFTAALTAATNAYTAAVKTFTEDYMKQDEYKNAQKVVDQANAELDAARRAVIEKLKSGNASYKAALQKEADAKKKLDQIRANGGNRDQISAQSKAILDAGDAVSKIEADVLAKDVAYQDCKKKLSEVVALLQGQKDALAKAIKEDTNLVALKETMDTTKTQRDEAQKKLQQDLATLGG